MEEKAMEEGWSSGGVCSLFFSEKKFFHFLFLAFIFIFSLDFQSVLVALPTSTDLPVGTIQCLY